MIHMTWNAALLLIHGTIPEGLSEESMVGPDERFSFAFLKACDWEWEEASKEGWFPLGAALCVLEGYKIADGEGDQWALPTCPVCKVLMDMCLEEGAVSSQLKSESVVFSLPAPGFGSPFDEEDD